MTAEFVAAQPGHEVMGRHRVQQPLRHPLQQGVADVVAEGVVDRLEIVEVDEQQRQRPGVGPGQPGGEPLGEEQAVGAGR